MTRHVIIAVSGFFGEIFTLLDYTLQSIPYTYHIIRLPMYKCIFEQPVQTVTYIEDAIQGIVEQYPSRTTFTVLAYSLGGLYVMACAGLLETLHAQVILVATPLRGVICGSVFPESLHTLLSTDSTLRTYLVEFIKNHSVSVTFIHAQRDLVIYQPTFTEFPTYIVPAGHLGIMMHPLLRQLIITLVRNSS
mgnify:CR=1 FL=1